MSVYLFQLRYENTMSIFNICGKIYSYNNVTEYIVLIVDYTHSDCTLIIVLRQPRFFNYMYNDY